MRLFILVAAWCLFLLCGSSCRKPVVGCMDPAYDNYNEEANEDDGCCCNVAPGEGDSARVTSLFTHAFANEPDSAIDMPVIYLQSSCFRRRIIAQGPCGCLQNTPSGPYPGYYDPADGVYGPREFCYTSLGWWCRLGIAQEDTISWSQFDYAQVDIEDWSALASANGFNPFNPILQLSYAVSFRSEYGDTLSLAFVDTIQGTVYLQNPPDSLTVIWANNWEPAMNPRRLWNELPCGEYPVDGSSVSFHLQSVEMH